jgi:ribosome recycling factor
MPETFFDELMEDAKKKMESVINATKKEFGMIRTGRANPSILDRVLVDYYGTPTPINQMASISVPEPRLLTIQPWDKSIVKSVEKAILQSDLGLVPNSDGTVIRIQIPHLTEERRRELVRLVNKEAEEGKVAVRNIRRQINADLKELEKSGDISEDDNRRAQTKVQEITDHFINEIDNLRAAKEKEIMEV